MSTSLRSRRALAPLLLVVMLAGSAPGASRADTGEGTRQTREQLVSAARDAAEQALIRGPAPVELKNQASLALPEHFGYVPRKEAAEWMRVMGNSTDESFLGLVVPLNDAQAHWFVTLHYEPSGYIKDDDAKTNWDAGKLLQSLKDGTESGNAQRAELGLPAIVVSRWIEPPAYDASTHRLVWAAEATLKVGADPDPSVNYNTYVLGRDGYISLDLVTDVSTVEKDKAAARMLLGLVSYNKGKDYGDFNSSTDKVAAYGLAALVAGVAAKKLGMLALFGAFFVKFAKLIIVAVVAFGAAISKWFKARFGRGGAPGA